MQYVSIRYTERLAAAGLERSVGSVGDSYDNALAETIIGLFKTLAWVDWFNNRRLLEPLGYVPPAEFEAAYYQQHGQAMAA